MFITTIHPRAVIWGKLLATVILATLIYSACMPFMMLSFMIRGVDLPSIALLLVVGFCVITLMIQLGIFAATISTALGFRVLLALMLLTGAVHIHVRIYRLQRGDSG